MTVCAILYLAAGFGTRMRPLTDHCPKPLLRVAGRSLLDHARAQAQPLDLREVANAHYRHAQIERALHGTNVAVSVEMPDILDSGGAVKNAAQLLGTDPVFTLNTDAVWTGENALTQLIAAWNPEHMDALLLCVPLARAVGRAGGGDFTLDDSGRLHWGGDMVYTGAQILKLDRVMAHPDRIFSLRDIWREMSDAGRLFGAVHQGRWCDVGHPEGIALAEEMLAHV